MTNDTMDMIEEIITRINNVYKGPCVAQSSPTHYDNITPISEIVRFID